MRADLQTHPKVVRMVSALKADKLRVIGGLHAVWSLFDAHSDDGTLDGYTVEALDDYINWPGFCAAMIKIGWLEENGESLATPRFDEHNGQSAKRRATETQRKRMARSAPEMSASSADKKRSREEKRREEKSSNTHTPLDDAAPSVCVTEPAKVCKAMKAAGIGDVNPGHPDLLMLLEAGATVAEFEGAALTASGKGKGFAYALGTLKRTRQDAANTAPTLHTGALPVATGETDYQRNAREKMTGWAPSIAAKAPGQPQPITVLEAEHVAAIGSH